MKEIQKKKGITLLALAITIIIMLLLAAITIQMTLGDNGLVKKANIAKEESEYNEVKDKLKAIVAKLGLEMNTKDADIGLNEIEEEIKKDPKLTYVKSADKINVMGNGYEFEIGKDLSLKAVGKKQEIIQKGYEKEAPSTPTPEEEDDDDTEWGNSSLKNIIDEPTGYDKLKNVFGYDSGARITYLTNPYSGGI